MSYTVYTKENCPSCDIAKKLLETKGISFEAFKIGEDIEVDDFKTRYPQARMVPFIVNDGEVVGGLNELRKMI